MANLQSTNIFGTLKVNALTPSSASSEGAFVVLGGVGIGKDLHVGGNIYASGNGLTITSINGLTISPAVDKTLDLSKASLTIGDTGKTGNITIQSNNTTARVLTLETSPTIKPLTANHVLFASAGNTISGEVQLAVSRGGTNIGSYATGDLLYASGATTLAKLTIDTAGKALVSTGTAPSWSVGTLTLSKNLEVKTGDVSIVGNASGSSLTLPAVLSVSALTKDHVLFASAGNTISGEAQLAVSRGGTGASSVDAKKAFMGPASSAGAPSWRVIISEDISDATNSNTANMIIKRDGSGGFSAGAITSNNTITANMFKVGDYSWEVSDGKLSLFVSS